MVTALAVVSFEALTVGQAPAPTAAQNAQKENAAPRTSDGRPDLQGVWDFRTATPLKRPEEDAAVESALTTDAQVAALKQRIQQKRQESADKVTVGVDNTIWFDQGDKLNDNRTSLIIDPPEGRFPPYTPAGQKRFDEQAAAGKRLGQTVAANPEDFSIADRCLLGFNSGPPMIPSIYNNNMQIVQTSDHVLVMNEMNHHARIIPLQDRPNLPSQVRHWQGDSRGRWEEDTLVVETTNFREASSGAPAGPSAIKPNPDENYHLIERFTRVDANTLHYRFTVDDPTIWTSPWTAEMTMTLGDGLIYEFACHEGNYSIASMLKAARLAEKAAATKGTSAK